MPITTYVPIQTYTVSGSSTNSMAFTNIPQTYRHLIIRSNSKASGNAIILARYNSDGGTNYCTTGLGASASTRGTSLADMYYSHYAHETTQWATHEYNIFNYASTSMYKGYLSDGSASTYGVETIHGLWMSNSPITQINIYLDRAEYWTAGSTFTLYGLA